MASPRKTKNDALMQAAVEYFAARSHNSWRTNFLKNNPNQRGKPRMRLRGGVMVDVNQPWSKLHAKAKADNQRAARDAYEAVRRFPGDAEAAANYVHVRWMQRNKGDASQPKALFKPYAQLPEIEKAKDRAHVFAMTKAIAAVRKPAPKKTPRKSAKRAAARTVSIDAQTWRRLERASKQLSAALGREAPVELLVNASAEAVAAMCKALAEQARAKRR
ncbi:MAG: hypothetical protein AB7P07_11665 [Hyphomonadaceae bacterium]